MSEEYEFKAVDAVDAAGMVKDAFALWLKAEHELEDIPEINGMVVAASFVYGDEESFYSFTHGLSLWEIIGMVEWIKLSVTKKVS